MRHCIEYCSPVDGLLDHQQDWKTDRAYPEVDATDEYAMADLARALDRECAPFRHRVAAEPGSPSVSKCMVDRYVPALGQWCRVEVEFVPGVEAK